ncbi:60S ribosomal protein L13a [Portunus trituberculatus]|uniref:Large ribosomal subunit protein uL13 n=1 Tax=Portunus trituberculatus TaxID=210409 RepID=A0A5B7CQG1_PORTR|nr:60S ribosomal protein L13a [Portunus trituberculatus]
MSAHFNRRASFLLLASVSSPLGTSSLALAAALRAALVTLASSTFLSAAHPVTLPILIDGAGHLLGRLAAIVAKTTLAGQRVVVVRCEKINISGSFYRNKLKYLSFLRKRCNVNPKRGPFHFRAPAKIFQRCVRALPFQYCFLGRLSHEVGWKYKSVVATLETRRKLKQAVLHKKRLTDKKLRRQALNKVSKRVEPYTKVMVSYGVENASSKQAQSNILWSRLQLHQSMIQKKVTGISLHPVSWEGPSSGCEDT